jgi:adenosylhomocysteine nucleosidase
MFLKSRNDFITASELQEFNILDPKALPGDIASGDQFVSTAAQSERIRNLLPQVKCVEMEGAAIAQVCYEYEVPFSIIRTISDRADDNSHIDFPSFAKSIASKYALGILYHYFKLKSN